MKAMTDSQWKEFIQHGCRTGKLSTIRADGRPHCVPVWCLFEEGKVLFMTWTSSQKAKNMRRDKRVCITFDSETFPYDFVSLEGVATIEEPALDSLLDISRRIATRYVPEEKVEAFASRNAVEGEVLVTIEPTRVISAKGVAN